MSVSASPVASFSPRLAGLLFMLVGALAGCDLTGEAALAKAAEQREADGKAVGSACRHAGRAIEDCYGLNPKAQRAAVFAGWREMDEYMRENKLDPVAPTLPAAVAKSDKGEKAEKAEKGEKADKSEKRAAAEPVAADAGAAKVALPPKPRVAKPGHS